ncbi:MAG TPA: MBL fold metallo-hydrolase, partial [bacterium]|nr:MBL fold metallo-hydrolase [bacterium]
MNKKLKKQNNNHIAEITFWGVRGSIPSPGASTTYFGGNTSCISIKYKDRYIILDAGSGIRIFGNHLIKENKISGNKVDLFISHTHWDHIQGLPFFATAFIKGNTIRILGPKLFGTPFEKVISNQMEHSYFPIRLKNLSADIKFCELAIGRYENLIDDITVETILNNHPVIDMGYKFIFPNNKVLCYISDFEYYSDFYYQSLKKSNKPALEKIGRKVLSDLRMQFLNFIENCDVLIIDSVYAKEEYPKKIGWGHSVF